MHAGNLARKVKLVDHGFRLPSALDNRPLTVSFVVFLINAVSRGHAQHTPAVVLEMLSELGQNWPRRLPCVTFRREYDCFEGYLLNIYIYIIWQVLHSISRPLHGIAALLTPSRPVFV